MKLREDGVFDMNKEIPFPRVPQRVAVISSDSAAGFGDFMDTIQHNHQGFHLETVLYPAVMQGDEAPGSIMGALDRVFESAAEFDCVALIRGGGSKADLECYNNYDLAFYITQFPLPVITGIGHERDQSVVDLVAAAGFKTPTAVAEFLVDQLLAFEFHLTALFDRLAVSVKRITQDQLVALERHAGNVVHLSRGMLRRKRDHLDQITTMLRRSIDNNLIRKKDQLVLMETRMELVNPENVLKRGYSITLLDDKAISDSGNAGPGDLITTRLHKGEITSKVEKTSE
jgi:exodeoxyribonuclease VII large subunit